MWKIALVGMLVALSGCGHLPFSRASVPPVAESSIELMAGTDAPEKLPVYVMSNGFHTGLIMRTADVPREAWPEVDEIPAHPWVEVGWGSEIFYRAKSITAPVVFGAVFPNASVLHVVGWDNPPEKTFGGGDLVRLELEAPQVEALCRHIHASYELDQAGKIQNLGPGIYGDATFFRGQGKYYFPNTCNVWTARGLKQAGIPITPELCGAADPVLMSVRKVGTTIRRR